MIWNIIGIYITFKTNLNLLGDYYFVTKWKMKIFKPNKNLMKGSYPSKIRVSLSKVINVLF